MLTNVKTTGLSTFALVMLITGAIDSIRNLPATALFGDALIFFFIFAAVIFLIPTALVSAELSSTWTKQSGIFHWVRLAFGEKTAFLAVWLQWINTMVWYPTILSFIAGTLTFLVDPQLAQNKLYMISVILTLFWSLTFMNLRGLQTSARVAGFCAIVGMIIPMALIIGLAAYWLLSGQATHLTLSFSSFTPNLEKFDSWISLTAIMAAFLGMELATVHVQNVEKPNKTFPKAMLFSVLIILSTMIFGALAIAIVLPQNEISLVEGVMQAFSNFFNAYHIAWLIPVLTIMLVIGSLGGMVNWIISPAKGLLQAAEYGYLPKFLQKENQHGVASNLLIAQAVLVSIVCLAFLFMPSVNGSYWLLTDLSTQLYMLMYIMMFVTAIYLRYKFADKKRPFMIPGGKVGLWFVCLLGIVGCCITMVVGFFPPTGVNVGSTLHFELMFIGGILLMLLPVFGFYFYKASNYSAHS